MPSRFGRLRTRALSVVSLCLKQRRRPIPYRTILLASLLLPLALSLLTGHISHATGSLTSEAVKTRNLQSAPGEFIVRFNPGSNIVQQTLKARSYAEEFAANGQQIRLNVTRLDQGPEIVEGLRLVRVSPDAGGQALQALRARADVIYAEPNYIRRPAKLPNDPRFAEMWGLKNIGQATDSGGHPGTPGNDIRAEKAWDVTTGSKSVVVGIIDEGIDINHEDLRDNIWTNPGEIPGNGNR